MVEYILRFCQEGYCLYTGDNLLILYAGTSLILGWWGIIIPMFVGLLMGFGIAWFWQEVRLKRLKGSLKKNV